MFRQKKKKKKKKKRNYFTCAKHRSSSARFSRSNWSSGYSNLGKGAIGHFGCGESSLWNHLAWVIERAPEKSFF